MVDSFGTDYHEASDMPAQRGLIASGFLDTVPGVMPSVNNAPIACGVWPAEHGIPGNSLYEEARGELDYTEGASYVRVPTVFQRGVESALLTAGIEFSERFSHDPVLPGR